MKFCKHRFNWNIILVLQVVEFAMTSVFEGELIGPILKGQAVQESSVDHSVIKNGQNYTLACI